MTKNHVAAIAVATAALLLPRPSAQSRDVNYDEAKIPAYTLPDVLRLADGAPVRDARTWKAKRRPELLRLFESEVYGRAPGRAPVTSARAMSGDRAALNGRAVRKQISLLFTATPNRPRMDLLVYLPAKAAAPVPVFIGLNFQGNHAVNADRGIVLSDAWMRANEQNGVVSNRATERSRGAAASRWPVDQILARGYGVVTAYYGDLAPDHAGGLARGSAGVHELFYRPGQDRPEAGEWGAIGAWAWGLSRALDYLETDRDIDARRVAVIGHSRLGKAALWAGAADERFAMVISNDSGAGGAALSKRIFGETVEHLTTSFPHWFTPNFRTYSRNEGALPVDQHMLLALIAPRPLYVASAIEDQWADPRGEFLGALHADPVYRLLGTDGLGSLKQMPDIDLPGGGTIGYHVRTGRHDIALYDWERYLDFADKHLRRKLAAASPWHLKPDPRLSQATESRRAQ